MSSISTTVLNIHLFIYLFLNLAETGYRLVIGALGFLRLFDLVGSRGLILSALDSGANGPGSSPGRGTALCSFGKTFYSQCLSPPS